MGPVTNGMVRDRLSVMSDTPGSQGPIKSFLTQRFAKIAFGQYSVIGYSVAGEETVVQVPELNVCFDIGRAPHFALTSDIVCLSHGHMDHLAGLAYYLSQRNFQGMKGGTVLLPYELHRGVDNLLKCWRDVERQGTPYTLVPMAPGQTYEVRRDFMIRALGTHHGGGSLGYSLVSVREKLKPEYVDVPGQELAAMRKRGVEIQYRVEVPLVTYLGDTTIGSVFEHPDVRNAEILITEITFFEKDHKQRAKVGKHLHVDHFTEIVQHLNNKHIVVAHVSRRTGIRWAKKTLAKAIGRERMANIHFLMDFENATSAGDVEDQGPLPPDTAE
jgi:ribonuclease Z